MKLGTKVKITSDYGHKGSYGVVVFGENLPPWAECFVKLDNNGGCYAFSKGEIEIIV